MDAHFPPASYSLPHSLQHASDAHSPRQSWRNRLGFRQAAATPDEPAAGTRAHGESVLHRTPSARSQRRARWWKVRLFRGMVADVRRRLPFYWSDWADAWDYRVVPATVYMYFAK
jgi:hypothetical protein